MAPSRTPARGPSRAGTTTATARPSARAGCLRSRAPDAARRTRRTVVGRRRPRRATRWTWRRRRFVQADVTAWYSPERGEHLTSRSKKREGSATAPATAPALLYLGHPCPRLRCSTADIHVRVARFG